MMELNSTKKFFDMTCADLESVLDSEEFEDSLQDKLDKIPHSSELKTFDRIQKQAVVNCLGQTEREMIVQIDI